ncbi:MAG: RNA 2',3'-cyclic phosphodiesterase [Candidatus Sungbacteria bacterium]|nr:RNA 2',3'-cyclic phosphodiesterase [Candidatus Sungbacteria bacterium]
MRRRIFIATGLSEELREKITEAVKRWQWLPIRWVPPQNWHITLVPPFYVTDQEFEAVRLLLLEEARKIHSFSIPFNSIELAPPGQEARMIWLFGAASEKLLELKRRFEERIVLEKSVGGFKKEERAVYPHITLARFEEGGLAEIEKKTRILEQLPLALEVSAIDIMESRLKITGAEYTLLDRISLLSNNKASVL